MKYFRIPHLELLVAPYIAIGVGFLMNAIAVASNGGQMPVEFPGGCEALKAQSSANPIADALGITVVDTIHSCMTHATHLKFLCDWVLYNGVGVMSPGDFFLVAGNYLIAPSLLIWLAWVIRDHHHANGPTF